jgi:hypothetical protein
MQLTLALLEPLGARRPVGSTQLPGSLSGLRSPGGRSPWARSFPPQSPPGASPHCSTASSVPLPRPTPHPRARSSFGFPPSSAGPTCPLVTDEASQFPTKELLHVHGVYSSAAGLRLCENFTRYKHTLNSGRPATVPRKPRPKYRLAPSMDSSMTPTYSYVVGSRRSNLSSSNTGFVKGGGAWLRSIHRMLRLGSRTALGVLASAALAVLMATAAAGS